MERLRELADYNCVYTITEDEVAAMSKPATEILNAVKAMIA